jgi:cytochrome c peroxidase
MKQQQARRRRATFSKEGLICRKRKTTHWVRRLIPACLVLITVSLAQRVDAASIDPALVRAAAQAAGLKPLSAVPLPPGTTNLSAYLNSSTAARTAAIQLGKALFWDMQVGSDGQSCASCHFHAGADSRFRNQLDPGLRSTIGLDLNPPLEPSFHTTATGGHAPDYTMKTNDFPFHMLANPTQKSFNNRSVLFDSDDILSSMGAFSRDFTQVEFPLLDEGFPLLDPIFNLDTPNETSIANNVRRVEPRNTPTVFNAVFNYANFWDGRAHNMFNGQSVTGPLDTNAFIWVNNGAAGAAPTMQQVRIPDSSLASQAVGPPSSDMEMSFFKRSFPLVGFKLLHAWQTNGLPLTPLGQQHVSTSDSVLGSLSRFPAAGLNATYANLIQTAFQSKYWNGADVALQVPSGNSYIFTHMEANFTLFFGLAIQMYEATLVSDQTPLDSFLSGHDHALTQDQLHGLLVFINEGENNPPEVSNAIAQAQTALGVPIGQGNCAACHAGTEFTAASFSHLVPAGTPELISEDALVTLQNGLLTETETPTLLDEGWFNIGVRPTGEDLGRGALADASIPGESRFPLSFTRQFLDPNLNFLLPPGTEPPCTNGVNCPSLAQVDGAFKVPDLRNVELTGPYFHNGGQRTLDEVIQFYERQGDFGDVNISNIYDELPPVNITDADRAVLPVFLRSLTDERVRQERAPFDHPQLFEPNGGTFANASRPEEFFEVPMVGSLGRPAEGLPALAPFMEAPPVGVTFYQNVNYAGTISKVLGPGDYTTGDLEANGVLNDTASAVKIPTGWTVTIFQNDNFSGTQFTFTSDVADFRNISGLNDTMSSCRITAGPGFADFSLSSSPSSVDLNVGSSATTTIAVNKVNGFGDTVSLSISGLPSGVTATFSSTNTTSASTLTLRAASTAPQGNFFVTVTGVDGVLKRSVAINVMVTTPDFALSASATGVTVARGSSATNTVRINPFDGFTGTVALSVSNLPAGVTASFTPSGTTSNSTLIFSSSGAALVGTFDVTVIGTSGGLVRPLTITLTVTGTSDFTLSAAPATVFLDQGSAGTSAITINRVGGFSGTVSLSASGLPSGVTASFNPSSTSGSSSTLTLSANSTAAIGAFPVTITGISGGLTHSTTVTVSITSPVYPAENATLGGGTAIESANPGFHGTGYANFPASGGTLTFTNVNGEAGGNLILRFRYALGVTNSRTGTLIVNGVSQNITFDTTGTWTNWVEKGVAVTLNGGLGNTVRLQTTGGDLANIDELTVIPATVPSPWLTRDIGAVTFAGSAGFANSNFTVIGNGNDIWSTADAFRFVYQSASGDCSITVRVGTVEDPSPFAKAGVMIRETINPDSRNAAVFVTPENGVRFQIRTATGGTTTSQSTTGLVAPRWVRLTRSGSTFTAFQSADGVTFTQVGTSQTISMTTGTFMGMAVTSHNTSELCTGTISNVTASP